MSSAASLPDLYNRLMKVKTLLREVEQAYRLHSSETFRLLLNIAEQLVEEAQKEKNQVDKANFKKLLKLKKQLPESVQFYIEDEWKDLLSSFGESA